MKIAAGLAIAAGTYIGRLADHPHARPAASTRWSRRAGFAAQATAGAVIYASTKAGYPLSTTHVISGAVMGSGATKRLSAVRWGLAGNIVFAWVLTIPAAALVAAAPTTSSRRSGESSGHAARRRIRQRRMYELLGRGRPEHGRHREGGRAAFPRASRPSSISQEQVKELEHEGDRARRPSSSAASNSQFQTPFDRDDLVELVFVVDEVADKIENASELLGLYGVEQPTRQSIELCGCLVRATEELATLLARLKGLRGSAEEIRTIKQIEDEADEVARERARASSRTTASTRCS